MSLRRIHFYHKIVDESKTSPPTTPSWSQTRSKFQYAFKHDDYRDNNMTQMYHHAKFRWTENLTSRFIQLRRENGKLFTGRKYSAQGGWEHILKLMRREFPTIMADVQYRVLKKKWSNLLQQYKEFKNPVQGDKNRADDVSWPFFNAIEEVVHGQRSVRAVPDNYAEDNEIEEEVDPHEFLCVSVTPSDEQISPPVSPVEEKYNHLDDTPIQVEEFSRSRSSKSECTPSISVKDVTKLRRTENQSRVSQQQLQMIRTAVNQAKRPKQSVETEVNKKNKRHHIERNPQDSGTPQSTEAQLVHKFEEFIEYTKQRDEENRLIMLRILSAVEKIADKF
ncbi:uncharacterized protein [Fopius arisanus]|uniref:Myb/SANT-like DNA-binding domain-containing protein n=2 Tax=Fopius arisanus TaxID=64838 RepID=A0A9R1TDF4_9HYME|nr:PREDICTED: uncharacterized protein LOC105269011 [Fopius arisanus]